MSTHVLVFVDQFKGSILPISWETLGVGRKLADELNTNLSALIAGEGITPLTNSIIQSGADQVFYCDDSSLSDYRPEPYATLVTQVARDLNCDVVLLPTTTRGRELAGMCAIDLNSGVLPDVTEIKIVNGVTNVTRPVYAGKILASAICDTKPVIITTRSRAFEKPVPDESRTGDAVALDPPVSPEEIRTRVIEYSERESGVSLNDAAVIVSGGRGISNNPKLTPPDGLNEKDVEIWRAQQGFKLIGELAEVLGAAVGASRAAVDAGYIPYDNQVGQTGKVVSPDLYIACGISGAIQHLAGMRTSKVIVAINKDPDAPIFKLARFGVIGDLYDIVPPLTSSLKIKLEA